MEILNSLVDIQAAGLDGLWNMLKKDWITPLFIGAVAIFGFMFIKNQQWMRLIGFVGIAAIVGVLVFAGGEIFGGSDKGLTKVAKDAAKKINTVAPDMTSFADSFDDYK